MTEDSPGRYWSDLLRPSYVGRKFIIVTEVAAAATPQVEFLESQGALRPFVIAAARGIGKLPGPDKAELVIIDLDLPQEATSRFMPFLRAVEAATTDPGEALMARIQEWDPDGSARVLSPFPFSEAAPTGRLSYGSRPAAYVALEDKMTVDGLWDEADVVRAPTLVTPLEVDALARAAVDLDWGRGTVWVGDNKEGWHGGAEYLRWVREPRDAVTAARFFREHCDQIRIMPFLEGTPCSIHGIVLGETVIAVRPIEMVVLGVVGEPVVQYVGTASLWDPLESIRNTMRGVARRVGTVLYDRVGFQGVFTIDGVATRAGFLPTELNPRFGAGLSRAVRGIEGLPLVALHRALIEGEDLDYRPAELEALLVNGADAGRNGSAFLQVPEAPEAEVEVFLDVTPDGPVEVDHESDAGVVVTWGEGANGGAIMCRFRPERLPQGESVAPAAAAALGYARITWPITAPTLVPLEELV